jgi:zinc transporter 9
MAGGGIKVVVSAIAGNSFITVIKFIGWFVSQSPSLLAEAVHSLADTLNQILLLVGLKTSKKGPTRENPTGSGGSRYLWNLISAVGIFFLGFGVTAFHGMHGLISGHYEPNPISWIGIGVLVVSLIIEMFVLIQAYNEVKLQKGNTSYLDFFVESDDPTLVAVLLEDGVAVLGVILALLGIVLGHVFGNALFDILASLVIALLLGFMAVALGILNSKLLVGKSVTIHKEETIKSFVESRKEVTSVEAISTRIIGAGKIRLSLEVELSGSALINQEVIKEDVKKVEQGESLTKIIHKSNERMVRITGNTINEIELAIVEAFPEVVIIDFEVN